MNIFSNWTHISEYVTFSHLADTFVQIACYYVCIAYVLRTWMIRITAALQMDKGFLGAVSRGVTGRRGLLQEARISLSVWKRRPEAPKKKRAGSWVCHWSGPTQMWMVWTDVNPCQNKAGSTPNQCQFKATLGPGPCQIKASSFSRQILPGRTAVFQKQEVSTPASSNAICKA